MKVSRLMFLCFVTLCATVANGLSTEFTIKNKSQRKISAAAVVVWRRGFDFKEVEQIWLTGPATIEPGGIETYLKQNGGEMDYAWVCIIPDQLPQWNPVDKKSFVITRDNIYTYPGKKQKYVRFTGNDETSLLFRKHFPGTYDLELKSDYIDKDIEQGGSWRFVRTDMKGSGSYTWNWLGVDE